MTGPALYCVDPHGTFEGIIGAAEPTWASAVVVLGDMEPRRPLHLAVSSSPRRGDL